MTLNECYSDFSKNQLDLNISLLVILPGHFTWEQANCMWEDAAVNWELLNSYPSPFFDEGTVFDTFINHYAKNITLTRQEKGVSGGTVADVATVSATVPDSTTYTTELIKDRRVEFFARTDVETYRFFVGYIDSSNPTIDKTDITTLSVKFYDNIKQSLKKKFDVEEVHGAKWLCNEADKSNSLAHILATKLGFSSPVFETIQLGLEPVKVPMVKWEKDSKVLSELTQIVDSFGGSLFINNEGNLQMFSPLVEPSPAVSTPLGLYKNFVPREIQPQTNTVLINYVNYVINPDESPLPEVVFKLDTKQTGRKPITKNSTSVKLKFTYAYDVLDSFLTPYISMEKDDNTKFDIISTTFTTPNKIIIIYGLLGVPYITITINIDNSQGDIVIKNDYVDRVWVADFTISGVPIKKVSDNTYKLKDPSIALIDEEVLTVSNKYIQTTEQAAALALYLYNNSCLTTWEYAFPTLLRPDVDLCKYYSVTVPTQNKTYTGILSSVTHNVPNKGRRESQIVLRKINYEKTTNDLEAETVEELINEVATANMQKEERPSKSIVVNNTTKTLVTFERANGSAAEIFLVAKVAPNVRFSKVFLCWKDIEYLVESGVENSGGSFPGFVVTAAYGLTDIVVSLTTTENTDVFLKYNVVKV